MKMPEAYTLDKIVDKAFIGENIFKLLIYKIVLVLKTDRYLLL